MSGRRRGRRSSCGRSGWKRGARRHGRRRRRENKPVPCILKLPEFSALAASVDATFSMPVDLREILPSTLKQAARRRAGEHKKTFGRVRGTESKFVDLSPTTFILAHVCTSFCWLSLVLIAPPGPPQLSNNFLSKGDRTRCTVDP
ncbi:hypothetical protein C1H46_003305 [Malus baccata]|uniref:Uncharacterized protein n=1 Tax=Malus baccata TaxID=106549 RepID=A0A540NJ41_MALBA|nr:hypothetical protein C1H46_003305 [Malus baccata]